jgi:hypothetical protein
MATLSIITPMATPIAIPSAMLTDSFAFMETA